MNVVTGNTRVSMSKYFEITLECLLNIIYFDIDNTFFTVGNQIYKQIKGIPMGSHLSPALAYLICEYYERRIPLTIPPQRLQFIFGGRYMDDILIVRLTPKDPDDPLHKLLDNDLLRITDTQRKGAIYHKDLTIKQEYDPRGALCLGSLIYINEDTGLLEIRYKNKNEESLLASGKQKTLRFQHNSSFSPQHQKRGTIMGEIVRIHRLTSNLTDKKIQCRLLSQELTGLGHKPNITKQLLIQRWKHTGDMTFKKIAQFLK